MSKKMSRLLVIDASVARASGEKAHPVSLSCLKYLKAVLEICHKVAFCGAISDEWKRHSSDFAKKWRATMTAKKKVVNHIQPTSAGLNLEEFQPRHRQAIEKDLVLIETALSTDKVIVTLDAALKKALGSSPEGKRLLNRIIWHHPVEDGTGKLEPLAKP